MQAPMGDLRGTFPEVDARHFATFGRSFGSVRWTPTVRRGRAAYPGEAETGGAVAATISPGWRHQ